MTDDLTLNVDYLVEFLAVARDWRHGYVRRPELSSEDADLYDACDRLFVRPEPAPALPAELAAALRAWRGKIEIHNALYPEVQQLAALVDRLLPPEPNPSRCAVPGCDAVEIGPWGWHVGSGDSGRWIVRDACCVHGRFLEALLA